MKKDNIPYDEKLDFGSGCEKKIRVNKKWEK
jgi:hypothetical protein